MKAILFDVDGTLTESRRVMDSDFRNEFIQFCSQNDVFLVTGSDKPKTIEQIGLPAYNAVKGAYQCNGNESWRDNRLVKKNDFTADYDFKHFLLNEINRNDYKIKTGSHVEFRTGMCNFSVIGRNCNQQQREEYYHWDIKTKQREKLASKIMKTFPDLTASLGGQISIDIYPKGKNKAQVVQDLIDEGYTEMDFFGDKCEYGGNDFPLSETIRLANLGNVYKVDNWEHTRRIINEQS
jgi:phosphomannomutase